MKKILVGIDGSEVSTRALDRAIELVKLTRGELTVAHVLELMPPPGEMPISVVADYERGMRDFAQALLQRAVSRAVEADLHVSTRILLGSAAQQLADLARSEGFDLLVVGSRGRGLFERALLGSTSASLSHRCAKPLLIVP